ncbi:MAG: hypothetical protein WC831_05195 [Parcubacteria group bacterium]|jgi:hypothetical protein
MAKKTDKRIILASSITFLIVAFFGWFSFFHETNKVKEITETIEEKKLESTVAQEKRDKIIVLKKELSDMELYNNEMKKMLMNKNDAVPFLRSLEKIAADTSNSIKIEATDLSKLKIKQGKGSELDEDETGKVLTKEEQVAADVAAEKAKEEGAGNMKNSLGFTLELAGTFPATVDFIDKMENLPYFIGIYNMDISSTVKEKKMAASGGVLAAGGPITNPEDSQGNKNVKMTMIIIVGTNDGN